MRSISLGAEERSPLSLSALLRQQDFDGNVPTTDTRRTDRPLASANDDAIAPEGTTTAPGRASGNSSNHIYQPRFAHHRGRSSTGHPQSHSSASSSLGRGNALPVQGVERERERDREPCSGSGSNSGISVTTDSRRGGGVTGNGRRFSFNRNYVSPSSNFEDDEPLLFAMSDFGVSRRSLEEGRRGSLGGGEPVGGGGNGGGSRRGSNRRAGAGGGTLAGFLAWQ
jgi:autophagy-related protein 13